MGDLKAKCYKLIGYPPSWNKSKQSASNHPQFLAHSASLLGNPNEVSAADQNPATANSEGAAPSLGLTTDQYNQLLNLLNGASTTANLAGNSPFFFCSSAPSSPPATWIIDSGASNHMTHTLSFFTNHASVPHAKPVKLPTGDVTPISYIGSVKLSNDLCLDNVLCVPNFHFNLLSISKLTSSLNCAAIFFPSFCVFQDLSSRKLIGVGEVRDGLYHYIPPPTPSPIAMPATYLPESTLWHIRLGHPSAARLSSLSSISSRAFSFHLHCDVCQFAKQTRRPFYLNS